MRQTGDLPLATAPESTNRPAPAEASTPILAASVIVVRPHAQHGFEVLLMERSASSRNFAGALVFPGGKVDAGDAAIAQAAGFEQLWPTQSNLWTPQQMQADTVASLYGAVLRETLEEVGLVWTAAAQLPEAAALQTLREALLAGTPWPSTSAIATSVLGMQPFSRWITPQVPNFSTKRFDTWFLLAQAPEGQIASADACEATRLVWDTPQAFLHSHQQREILLAPPQLMTLAHLSRFASIAALQSYAQSQAPYCIAPVSIDHDGQRIVCFPGDPLHSEATVWMPGPQRLVMRERWFEPVGGFEDLWR